MLVLTIKRGSQIDITLEDGRRIEIHALNGSGGYFRIGFDAPKSIVIDRHEVTERKWAETHTT